MQALKLLLYACTWQMACIFNVLGNKKALRPTLCVCVSDGMLVAYFSGEKETLQPAVWVSVNLCK